MSLPNPNLPPKNEQSAITSVYNGSPDAQELLRGYQNPSAIFALLLSNFAEAPQTMPGQDIKVARKLHAQLVNECQLFPTVMGGHPELLQKLTIQRPNKQNLPTVDRLLNQITYTLHITHGVAIPDVVETYTAINSRGIKYDPQQNVYRIAEEGEAADYFGPFSNIFNQEPFADLLTMPKAITGQQTYISFSSQAVDIPQVISLTAALSHQPIPTGPNPGFYTNIAPKNKGKFPVLPLSTKPDSQADGKKIADFIKEVQNNALSKVRLFLEQEFNDKRAQSLKPRSYDDTIADLIREYWKTYGGMETSQTPRQIRANGIWPTKTGLSLDPVAMIPSFRKFCDQKLIRTSFGIEDEFNRHGFENLSPWQIGREVSGRPDPGPSSIEV